MANMKSFALIGASGYIAPRHMQAIKETGNKLSVAYDPSDSVGVIDSYFPQSSFFTEFERFDRHVHKLKRNSQPIDYVTVCSPNYLHDAHIRFALRSGSHAICEKPLVVNPWNLDGLKDIEQEFNKKVYTILQLRHHPTIMALKERVDNEKSKEKYDIELSYVTSRGAWYHVSWKGDESKSGGVATNIGIHFFDMLSWIFGAREKVQIHVSNPNKIAGFIEYKNARVKWLLSIDSKDLPEQAVKDAVPSYRLMKINGEEIEFSTGFKDLHTVSYEEILEGRGYGVEDSRNSIEAVYDVRNSEPIGLKGDYHPRLKEISIE